MDAVGSYITTLREGRGLTQQQIVDLLGVSERTVRNWEHGKVAPGVDALSRLLALLEGSWVHIAMLIRDGVAAEAGKELAQRQLLMGVSDDQRAVLEGLDFDQLEAIVAVAKQMKQ